MQNPMLKNDKLLLLETLYSTANGYVGMRANFEEGYSKGFETIRGTYINGAYEIYDVKYGENAYGFPQTAQKIINVIDAQTIEINIGGEAFTLFEGTVITLERELDIYKGYAKRKVEWLSPKGHHLIIEIKRMASFVMRELIVIDYSITSKNYSGEISIASKLDGDVKNYSNKKDMRVASGEEKLLYIKKMDTEKDCAYITTQTKRSGIEIAAHMAHDIDMYYALSGKSVEAISNVMIKNGQTVSFTKFVVYTDSLRHEEPVSKGKELVKTALAFGKEHWFEKQNDYLNNFWEKAHISIDGDPKTERSLNYNIYQLLASAGVDSHSNISAKGLSGEGYEGHYFWDTEIYMIPLFMHTNIDTARCLLKYRYNILDKARIRSLQMGHRRGAKIPWRTISGDECSPYFPAGSAQYHINSDVAYSYIQYYFYTKDIDMMMDFGFETIYETARIWLEIGHFDNGHFKIDAVTGPDEYTAIVNNNYYTNVMAKHHMEWAVKFANILKEHDKKRFKKIADRMKVSNEELGQMHQAAQKMYLPFDSKLNVNLQDDSFIHKADWDFEGTSQDKYPLLLNFHPLTIYRYKVLKQADTLLAHMLLDNEEDEVVKNCFNYYEKYTTHDSSLSSCVHSIMAARIGDAEKAYKYFMHTIRLDLDDINSNTKDGLHLANAGGAYMGIVYGFGGLRIKEDGVHISPTKPERWEGYQFKIKYLGSLINIKVSDKIMIGTDRPCKVFIYNEEYNINDSIIIDIV